MAKFCCNYNALDVNLKNWFHIKKHLEFVNERARMKLSNSA